METMRLILIFLHVFIIIFAAINLHPQVTTIADAPSHRKKLSAIICYIFELLRLSLYHTASIIAVWFSRRYSAGMIRASGLLLIGELLQVITSVIQKMLETHHLENGEIYFLVIYDLLLLTALLMTFRLAEKISKHQKSSMQIELLADTVHDISTDNNVEPTVI